MQTPTSLDFDSYFQCTARGIDNLGCNACTRSLIAVGDIEEVFFYTLMPDVDNNKLCPYHAMSVSLIRLIIGRLLPGTAVDPYSYIDSNTHSRNETLAYANPLQLTDLSVHMPAPAPLKIGL